MPIKILFPTQLVFIGCICLFLAGCSYTNKKPAPSAAPSPTVTASDAPQTTTPPPAPEQYDEYNVKLDVRPAERTVTGVEKIQMINTYDSDLNMVYINVPLNAFSENPAVQPVFSELADKVYPNGVNYGYMLFNNIYVDGDPVSFSLKGTVLSISLPETLPPGESTEIKLELSAKAPIMNNRTGADESGVWFGNFLPMMAVRDAEGWHTDPYYPAGDPFFTKTSNFYVSVTAPSEYTAAGPGIPVVTDNDGTKTTDFTLKLARDFAFALNRRYTVSSATSASNVEISLYTFSNPAHSQDILSLASRGLAYYSGLLGAYPYSQLVIVETKLFGKGGMAYPGVIFIDSGDVSASGALSPITREIGRQWFYNIIGSNQIENAWMNVGLVSFVQDGFTLKGPDLDRKMSGDYDSLRNIIAQITPNTLNSGLGEFKSWSDYDNIQNVRGELMFYSLYKKIGEGAFNDFLAEYNRRYSFRIATPDGLMQTAEDISGVYLSAFFNAWINDPELPPLT